MQVYRLLDAVLAGISVLAIILFFLILFEKYRFASGKEMLTGRFIDYLEGVHRQTDPDCGEEVDVREYHLSDKVKIMELYIREQPGKKDQAETAGRETNG